MGVVDLYTEEKRTGATAGASFGRFIDLSFQESVSPQGMNEFCSRSERWARTMKDSLRKQIITAVLVSQLLLAIGLTVAIVL
jgi:hypothetical protein